MYKSSVSQKKFPLSPFLSIWAWVFLGVIFHEKTFLFYEILLVSKQNLEKMAPISWNIVTNIASMWFFKHQNEVKCVKMLLKPIILLKFILRKWWYGHRAAETNYERRNSTKLSGYIWSLKLSNPAIPYTLDWRIIDRGRIFNPVTRVCRLCLKEKWHIMFIAT